MTSYASGKHWTSHSLKFSSGCPCPIQTSRAKPRGEQRSQEGECGECWVSPEGNMAGDAAAGNQSEIWLRGLRGRKKEVLEEVTNWRQRTQFHLKDTRYLWCVAAPATHRLWPLLFLLGKNRPTRNSTVASKETNMAVVRLWVSSGSGPRISVHSSCTSDAPLPFSWNSWESQLPLAPPLLGGGLSLNPHWGAIHNG